MAKPKDLPTGYKKTDVALMMRNDVDGPRKGQWKAVMRDNSVWWNAGETWTKEGAADAETQSESDGAAGDEATKRGEGSASADGAQQSGGGEDPARLKEANLLNMQAKLHDEGAVDQAPVNTEAGGVRTLSEADLKAAGGKVDGVSGGVPQEAVDKMKAAHDAEVADLKSKLADKENKEAAQAAQIAKLQAAQRGVAEGKPQASTPGVAPTPMAGPYPADISKVPTADELNANNGQPESAPNPAERGQRELRDPPRK